PESHRRIFFVMPGPKLPDADCARQIVKRFAARAFRRPVADDEVTRLLTLYTAARAKKQAFIPSVVLSLEAVLVSPRFLFRMEDDPPPAKTPAVRALSDYEVATRLSYFLWSSMPDDRLFELAAAGTLAQPEARAAEVRRMLADPKAAALVQNFLGQ